VKNARVEVLNLMMAFQIKKGINTELLYERTAAILKV